MPLPQDGLAPEQLFDRLERARERDTPWRNGRTWAYVYDAGPEVEAVAKRAFADWLSENALDPTVFPSLVRLENEVIGIAADHLRAGPGAAGSFTSGGTESCMLAVKAARDHARSERGIERPQVVMPVTAHAAFHKAAHYFDVDLVLTGVDPTSWKADVGAVRDAITDRTALIVASAPGYAHGVIDPIEELGALAADRALLLHVDACVGGWILPFWRELGAEVPPFDFSVRGVTSISMDLHKYAFCPKGASVVLYRDAALRRHQVFACAGWTGYTVVNPTIQSSKSGGPVAAAWAVLHHLGRSGYRELARTMLEGTTKILEGIRAIPELDVLGEPVMNLVAFGSDRISVFALADAMKARGWYVQPQLGFAGSRPNIHLSINPACVRWADELLTDLRSCSAELARAGEPFDPAALAALAAQLGGGALDDATFDALLAGAGLNGMELPERLAGINHLLDAAGPDLTAEVLKEYLHRLYRPAR